MRCRPECGYEEIGHRPFLDELDWPHLPGPDIDKLRLQLHGEGDEEGFPFGQDQNVSTALNPF